MQAREIMTKDPACCTPADSIRQAATLMVEHNCGFLPVVESQQQKQLLGVVTDRDIVCRMLAQGKDGPNTTVQDAMTTGHLWTAKPDDAVETVIEDMAHGQVRRIPIVDDTGTVQGIIATADIALEVQEDEEVAQVFEDISQPTHIPHA